MEIIHDEKNKKFFLTTDGKEAYVSYVIHDKTMDILHTVVPKEIGGRGFASALVQAAYDYARSNGMQCAATCTYAISWIDRHPEYKKTVG